jgi:hypothetical protein
VNGATEAKEAQDARQLVVILFDRLSLGELRASDMLVLLGYTTQKGPLGSLIYSQLRLRYFGATAAVLP